MSPPRELYNRIVVTFINKNLPGDTGTTFTLNQRMTYPMVCLNLLHKGEGSRDEASINQSVCKIPAVLLWFCPQMAKEVAHMLGTDAHLLQFFKPQG